MQKLPQLCNCAFNIAIRSRVLMQGWQGKTAGGIRVCLDFFVSFLSRKKETRNLRSSNTIAILNSGFKPCNQYVFVISSSTQIIKSALFLFSLSKRAMSFWLTVVTVAILIWGWAWRRCHTIPSWLSEW